MQSKVVVLVMLFGMQLLKNETVKQYKNNHSCSWGDVEQEFAGNYFILFCNQSFSAVGVTAVLRASKPCWDTTKIKYYCFCWKIFQHMF